ncbi:MAG: WYL domain-containing protein, partial [Actinomycetota bacterium]|nr:WYL domain-containing protein [Actinomycetota bacterium]
LRQLAARCEPADDGASTLTIDYSDLDRLAGMIAGAGTDAVALQPPELIKSVVALLSAAAGGRR